jgi:hypothetical protein
LPRGLGRARFAGRGGSAGARSFERLVAAGVATGGLTVAVIARSSRR